MAGEQESFPWFGATGGVPTEQATAGVGAEELSQGAVHIIQEATTEAAIGSMHIVREAQRSRQGLHSRAKREGVLTDQDFTSEDAARNALRQYGDKVPILGEERGLGSDVESDTEGVLDGLGDRIIWIVDALDGSRPFANGAGTSTVIVSAWDKQTKRFVATTIGHPQSGLVLEASNGQTVRWEYDYRTGERSEPIPCQVAPFVLGQDSSAPTLLVENFQKFAKGDGQGEGKHTVFTVPDLLRLQHIISPHMAIQNMGSNGWHFAMLAVGGERLGGMMMTSIGNPGDAAGLQLVENAGGAVRAFYVDTKRELEEVDPHDVIDDPEAPTTTAKYDIVVAGATIEIAGFVSDALKQTFNRQLGITI